MLEEVRSTVETTSAATTLVRADAEVSIHVDFEVGFVVEAFSASHTGVAPLLCVRAEMLRQRTLACV